MSLRTFHDQLDAEDDARRQFEHNLGPALPHYRAMSKEEVRDLVGCPTHVSNPGVHCGCLFGLYWNCTDRRVAAAKLKAAKA